MRCLPPAPLPAVLACALFAWALVACGGNSESPLTTAASDPEAEPDPTEVTPSNESDPAAPTDEAATPPPLEAPAPARPSDAGLPAALRDRFTVFDDTPTRDGERSIPRALEHKATGLLFLYVPGGSFTLGSDADDPDRFDDERPPRRVRLTGFYLSATETTLAAWNKGGGSAGSGAENDHPVTGITWYEARDWCIANGLSLPSEAQWEYAASGSRDDLYPWGFDLRVKGRANAAGTNEVDQWLETSPVGSFAEGTSWCGAVDLAGNVMEWCRDGWTADHVQIEDGALDPVLEPEGDAPAIERLVRGGSFETDALLHFRCAYRNAFGPTLAGGNLGFRAVVPPF